MEREQEKEAVLLVFDRYSTRTCVEEDLVYAVIEQAVKDIDEGPTADYRADPDSRAAWLNEDMDVFCRIVGLDPDYARRVLRKAGLL